MAVGGKGRRPRGSLAPDAIVTAAGEHVEQHGLAALTMSGLARAMGVPVTSVHWHFRTRDDLLDALADRITTELYDALPPVGSDRPWDEELAVIYAALREQLRKKPAFLELSVDRARLLGRATVKQRINARVEAEVAMLVAAGIAPDDAYRMMHVCSVFVRGFVAFELTAERQNEDTARAPEWTVLDPVTFPLTSQLDLFALSWGDADAQFRWGLDLLVGAIKAHLPGR